MSDNLDENPKEAPIEGNPPEVLEDAKITRYKEQLAGSTSEAMRYKAMVLETEIQKASNDANSLLELHKKDPKLANEVAKSFGYDSYEDVSSKLSDKKLSNNSDQEEDFDTKYNKRRAQEEHDKSLKKAEKIISKLDDELKDKAQSYFDKISKGHTLDEETALEFAEMATLYVSKDKLKGDKLEDGLAMLGSTGISNSKKAGESAKEFTVIRNGKLVNISSNN